MKKTNLELTRDEHSKREWPRSYWHDSLMCLKSIYQIPNYERTLTDGQKNILRDLERAIRDGQDPAESLFDFRRWNLKRIAERDQRPSKPRIAIVMFVTDKGNFCLRWRPVGEFDPHSSSAPPFNETDFDNNTNQALDQLAFTERPHNELMFIHDIWELSIYENRPVEFINQCLLLALKDQVEQWISRLRRKFELTLENDIDFQFQDERVIKWEIYNVEEKRIAEEKSWIEGFEVAWSMSPSKFLDFYNAANGLNKCEKMNRMLKKAGYKFAPRDVRAAVDRIIQHHGHLLEKPTA